MSEEFPTVKGVLTVTGALGLGFTLAVVCALAFEHASYNLWGAMLVVPCVIGINALLLSRVLAAEPDRFIVRILILGFFAKQVGTLARYYMAYVLYNGAADAEVYNTYAAWEYLKWRDGIFDISSESLQGTQWMKLLTTGLYTVIGPSPLAAFFVFTSFSFWGAVLLFKAFRLALPKGNVRLYAVIVFLLPSMLFWPSSLGKEAWLMFNLGLSAYGAASYFEGRLRGLLWVALGLVGTACVRPHLSVMLVMGLLVAQLFRPTAGRLGALATKFAGLLVLGGGLYLLATSSMAFLGLDDLSVQAVTEVSQERSANTEQGGSEFVSAPITSPLDIPKALFTVIFRPMVFEAHNLQMAIQAVEGLLLMGLFVWRFSSLWTIPTAVRHKPYVAFCVVYVLIFVWAFSGFGNFAILARQRVLMLPLLAVLLALPADKSAYRVPNPSPFARHRTTRDRVHV